MSNSSREIGIYLDRAVIHCPKGTLIMAKNPRYLQKPRHSWYIRGKVPKGLQTIVPEAMASPLAGLHRQVSVMPHRNLVLDQFAFLC